jgi:two-component system response regulator VanR
MNILVVEDDAFFQKFYVLKLQEQGYAVELAENGEVAIDILQKKKFDCILLDIIMPKKNGFEVLEFAQKSGITASVPIIMFSTLGQEEDMKKALGLGARDYVNKAFFDFDTLLQKIQSVTVSHTVV